MGSPRDIEVDPALEELERELGRGGLLRGGIDDLSRFETDARAGGGIAAAVARPADVEGVRAVVRWAVRHRRRLVPQGANTGLVGASVPDASGSMLVLSLERLAAPPVVDAIDATVTAAGGVRRSAIDEAAAPFGLCLPIDLSADPSVGGMVATNTGGTRMLRYGDVRDHVLSLEVVIADTDASVLRVGSGARKDNTGLDLKQVFIGTGGAFGVITEARLALHRRPTATAAALVAVRDVDVAVTLFDVVEGTAGEFLSAFELMSAAAMRRTLAHLGLPAPLDDAPYTVLVELSSTTPGTDLDAVLAGCLERLAGLEPSGLVDTAFGPPDRWWRIRHDITASLRAGGEVIAFDVGVPRSKVGSLLIAARGLFATLAPAAELCEFGHLGDGGVHLNLVFPTGVGGPGTDLVRSLRAEISDLVVSLDGSFSAEHGLGPVNAGVAERYADPVQQDVVAALRRRFDPTGVFDGRFVV